MSEQVAPARSRRLPLAHLRAQADRRRCLEWPASSRRPAPCPHRKDRPPLVTSVCCLGSPTELAVPPPRHHLGTQSKRAAKLLGRSHGLLCGLPIDKENLGEGEDKVGAFLQGHVSVSRSAHLKRRLIVEPAQPTRAGAQPRKATMLKRQPWATRRSPRMASPFSSDRQHGRIRPR